MAQVNLKNRVTAVTHEGGPAYAHMNPEQALRRSVMSCLLWESEFYEDGVTIADRIRELAHKVHPKVLGNIADEARNTHNLRHVPLLLVRELLRHKDLTPGYAEAAIHAAVRRVDEMAELLALYWATNDGKKTLPHALTRGLAEVFGKFNEYQLAKYDRDGAVKLRDVLRLARPKPKDEVQSALFKRVKDRTLVVPDTWEVELSAGKDKKETFEWLIREGKLGYLALLRNLRNMVKADVDPALVCEAIEARKGGAERVLPFRYIAAARAAPQFEPSLDIALRKAITELPVLKGLTVVLVDVSGSMDVRLSAKSDLTRADAAAALASIINGNVRMFSFSNALVEVPPRRGMAGVDVLLRSQSHSGTALGAAVNELNRLSSIRMDRLIVITDEQSNDKVPEPNAHRSYMINVASAKHGVGYGKPWVHIDGFSEGVLKFINEIERGEDNG